MGSGWLTLAIATGVDESFSDSAVVGGSSSTASGGSSFGAGTTGEGVASFEGAGGWIDSVGFTVALEGLGYRRWGTTGSGLVEFESGLGGRFDFARRRLPPVMMSVRRSGTISGSLAGGVGVAELGGRDDGVWLFFRVSRILAVQCGQTTEAILGSRTNSNRCLHFGQVAGVFFGFEDDIGTKAGNVERPSAMTSRSKQTKH